MKAGSSGRRGTRGSELLRLLAGPPRHRGGRGHGPFPRRPGGGGAHAVVGRRLPGTGLRGGRPARRPRPGVLRPAPRGVAADRARSCGPGRGHRRPGGRLPAAGRRALPDLVRRGARGARAAGQAVYGLPELFRPAWPGPRSSPPPAATRRRPDWPWRPCCGPGLVEPERDHRRRRLGRLGGRPGRQGVAALRDGRRGLRGLRPADPSPHARDGADPGRAQVLFTPHLAPWSAASWPPVTPAAARAAP
jgi:hypothetical protein